MGHIPSLFPSEIFPLEGLTDPRLTEDELDRMKKQVEEERSRYQEEHLGQAVLKYAQDVFAISMFKNIKYDQIITCLKLGHLFLSSFSHHFPYEAWIKISPTSRVLGKTSKARGGSGACDASQRRGQVRSCQGSWRSWRWVFSAPENPHGSIDRQMVGVQQKKTAGLQEGKDM